MNLDPHTHTMDIQTLFNIVAALCIAMGGGIIKALWDKISLGEERHVRLSDKVHDINTLVVGDYVKRDEFTRVSEQLRGELVNMSSQLFQKLDNMNESILNRLERRHQSND